MIPESEAVNAEAWAEWINWRRTEKKIPVGDKAERLQQKMLAGFDHDQQRQIIEHSIMNSYQGLFPLKTGRAAQASSTRHRTLQEDLQDRSWAQ